MAGNDTPPAIRLAFRSEGEFVNCYLAEGDTMNGALLSGGMRRGVLDQYPAVWSQWKAMLNDVFRDLVANVLPGATATFEERPAPEHERVGRA